jgi:hypothetical protein
LRNRAAPLTSLPRDAKGFNFPRPIAPRFCKSERQLSVAFKHQQQLMIQSSQGLEHLRVSPYITSGRHEAVIILLGKPVPNVLDGERRTPKNGTMTMKMPCIICHIGSEYRSLANSLPVG